MLVYILLAMAACIFGALIAIEFTKREANDIFKEAKGKIRGSYGYLLIIMFISFVSGIFGKKEDSSNDQM